MNEMFKTVIENLPMVFSLLMGMGLIVLEAVSYTHLTLPTT